MEQTGRHIGPRCVSIVVIRWHRRHWHSGGDTGTSRQSRDLWGLSEVIVLVGTMEQTAQQQADTSALLYLT